MEKFDSLAPFENKELFEEIINEFRNFEYKLYGKREIKFHRGKKNKYEFDLNLGLIHFTEMDFEGISRFVKKMNKKWRTKITYCIYTSKENPREIILNVRSPKAPMEID